MSSSNRLLYLSSNRASNRSVGGLNTTATALDVCVSDELLRVQGSQIENIFFTYIFPPLFFIGIIGNCLNLIVLLNGGRRARRHAHHRSNRLLVALAVCDIIFLNVLVPHSLVNFDVFGFNYSFRIFYFVTKIHLISVANWCSATAIWLIIAVCTERLLGIRSLLRENSQCSRCTTAHLITIIVFFSGLLTFYTHFSHHCIIKRDLCNHTQVISKCFDVVQDTWAGNRTNFTPMALRTYVRWSSIANAVLIFIPCAIVLVLNVALLVVVRKQSFLVYKRLSLEQHHCADKRESAGNAEAAVHQFNGCREFRKNVDQNTQGHVEHRVTITVAAIVTCFTIFQIPSAVVLSLSFIYGHSPPFVSSNPLWYNLTTSAGMLVIIGKTLNFLLFCLSSSAFRSRLFRKLGMLSRKSSFFATSTASSLRKYSNAADRRQSLAL
ncbi:putative G-protein coupled receptor F59B2.13 [Aphelenchoides fujianensis]|nr:putative G-protein coupled receptor F59B2.13 [Aphelenchoides fujianensis]